jgi:acetolactate synthase-1/2/3 large subunit
MEKLTDFVARRLQDLGIVHVFMVTGGGAMHLNDSLSHRSGLNVIYCHHEQACAIAAEGAYRATGRVACVNVTTGPGGLNTLTGVLGQWTDSIPAIYISGQVKFETTIGSCPALGLRQLGDQEVDIVSIVKPIVKYAVQVNDPSKIRYELEKAFAIAMSGRMGPVWLDIPMNVQGALVDETTLPGYIKASEAAIDVGSPALPDVIDALASAKRPLVVLGHGIRLAGAIKEMEEFLSLIAAPVVTTFNGFDLVPERHSLFVGRIGTLGSRSGNFALQNADLVLELGSRNNIRQSSYDWANFAHRAKRIIVDIDEAELRKPTVSPTIPVHMDVRRFLTEANRAIRVRADARMDHSEWLSWCKERMAKYPVVLDSYSDDSSGINPYFFFKEITRTIGPEAISVAGNGTACVCLFQAGIVNPGTRFFWNSGCASMGYDLPAALGAAAASRHSVFCFAGDGSLQMNIQELQTIVTNKLSVKILYLNNGGYISIKQTQDSFFHRRAGCDANSGIEMPSMERLAGAYGIPYIPVRFCHECAEVSGHLLSFDGPGIAEVFLSKEYAFMPKTASERLPDGRMVSKPLEDLFPFLDRGEFEKNMIR